MQGHTDIPLNETGRKQAAAAARFFQQATIETMATGGPYLPSAVYSSDLARAAVTGDMIAETIGMTVTRDERLREMNLGIFQTLTKPEAATKYGKEWTAYCGSTEYIIPDGESRVLLFQRV